MGKAAEKVAPPSTIWLKRTSVVADQKLLYSIYSLFISPSPIFFPLFLIFFRWLTAIRAERIDFCPPHPLFFYLIPLCRRLPLCRPNQYSIYMYTGLKYKHTLLQLHSGGLLLLRHRPLVLLPDFSLIFLSFPNPFFHLSTRCSLCLDYFIHLTHFLSLLYH